MTTSIWTHSLVFISPWSPLPLSLCCLDFVFQNLHLSLANSPNFFVPLTFCGTQQAEPHSGASPSPLCLMLINITLTTRPHTAEGSRMGATLKLGSSVETLTQAGFFSQLYCWFSEIIIHFLHYPQAHDPATFPLPMCR